MRLKHILSKIGASLLTATMLLTSPLNVYANEGDHFIDRWGNDAIDCNTGDDECYFFIYVEDNLQFNTVEQDYALIPRCSLEYGDNHLFEKAYEAASNQNYAKGDFSYTPFLEEEVVKLTYGTVYVIPRRVVDGYYTQGKFLNDWTINNLDDCYVNQLVRIDGSVPFRAYDMLFDVDGIAWRHDGRTKLTIEDLEKAQNEFIEWAKEWDKQYPSYSTAEDTTHAEIASEEVTTIISVEPETTIEEVTTETITEKETLPEATSVANEETEKKSSSPIIKVIIGGVVIVGLTIIGFKAAKK